MKRDGTASVAWPARLSPSVVALVLFAAAGVFEAVHGYIGYNLSGRPEFGYTLRGQPLTLPALLARTMPSWIVLGALAGVTLRVAEHRPLFTGNWQRSLLFHVPMAFLFAAGYLAMAAAFRHFLFVGPEAGVTFATTALRYYTVYYNNFFLYYWGIVGVYSGFVHYRDLRQRELQAEKLQRQLTEARLRALQQQIEPHFLFNTLNAVSGLALEGNVDGTVRTLALLGELLRETLRRDEQVLTVAEELDLLDLYLGIQQTRLEERLQVRKYIDPDTLDAEVPTFLLQPLVENAVRHGVSRDTAAGWVEIRVRRREHRLEVTVTDSGRGLGHDPVEMGVGLTNCVARLEQLYGRDFQLDLRNAETGGAQVHVAWPYKRLQRDTVFPTRTAGGAGANGRHELPAAVKAATSAALLLAIVAGTASATGSTAPGATPRLQIAAAWCSAQSGIDR